MIARTITAERGVFEDRRPAGDPQVRVLIADHDGLARRMMQNALQEAAGVVVITAARDGREALELACYYQPTVLLVDLALPPAGAAEVIRKILPVVPKIRIVTVSATADTDQAALASLRAGAVGHIDKDVDPDQLGRLVTLAADGEAIVPRRMTMPLLELLREVPDGGWRPLRSALTTREWQIVELLAEGASTECIAERLVLSPTTIYSHVNSVLRKLGVHSRRDAVAAAKRLRHQEALVKKPSTEPGEAPQRIKPLRAT